MVIGGILHHHGIDGDTIADIALVYPKAYSKLAAKAGHFTAGGALTGPAVAAIRRIATASGSLATAI